jgi:hypothetical protein
MVHNELATGDYEVVTLHGAEQSASHSQLLLAEDLPLDVLLARVEDTTRFDVDSPLSDAKRNLARASAELEAGLSRHLPVIEANTHLDDADSYTERVLMEKQTRFNPTFFATRFQAYWPKFNARRHDLELTDTEQCDILLGLGTLIDTIDAGPIHRSVTQPDHLNYADHTPCFSDKPDKFGLRVKVATDILLARAGLDVYPSSSRERETFIGVTPSEAHDGYIIKAGRKIAYKAKFHKEKSRHHNNVHVYVAYGGLLRYAARETNAVPAHVPLPVPDLQAWSEEIIDASVAEVRGKAISSAHKAMLDVMTERVKDKFEAVRQTI